MIPMTPYILVHALRTALASAALAAALPLAAAPVTHYSAAAVGSSTVPGQSSTDTSGATVSASNGGSTTRWRTNPATGANYSQDVTSAGFASAGLATGSLSGSSFVRLDNTVGTPRTPDGSGHSYHSWSQSLLADRFVLQTGDAAFAWKPQTTFTFTFDVSGIASLAPGLVQPVDSGSGSFSQAALGLVVYKTGTLDLMDQRDHIDWSEPGAWEQFVALSNQISASRIDGMYWYLGDQQNRPEGWDDITSHLVDLASGAGQVNHAFAPGGDFEWLISLQTQVSLEDGLDAMQSSYDFSHTVNLGFIAPDGATVASASGLFPGTVAIGDPVGIPEPNSMALLLLATVAAAATRRRS